MAFNPWEVHAATTAALPSPVVHHLQPGSNHPGACLHLGDSIVDGVSLVAGSRILVLYNDTENGIYVVSAVQGEAQRARDLAVGTTGAGLRVFVRLGGRRHGGCLFLCTNVEPEDVVGTHALRFTPSAEAGLGLERVSDGASGSRLTWQLRVDSSTMGLDVDGTLALRRVPGECIDDASVPPSKLVHPGMGISLERGLQGGGHVDLGGTTELGVDFSVVPDLAAPSRVVPTRGAPYSNTFQRALTIADETPSHSHPGHRNTVACWVLVEKYRGSGGARGGRDWRRPLCTLDVQPVRWTHEAEHPDHPKRPRAGVPTAGLHVRVGESSPTGRHAGRGHDRPGASGTDPRVRTPGPPDGPSRRLGPGQQKKNVLYPCQLQSVGSVPD